MQAYGPLSLSPDGKRLAITIVGASSDVWVYELTRGTFTRLTVDGSKLPADVDAGRTPDHS